MTARDKNAPRARMRSIARAGLGWAVLPDLLRANDAAALARECLRILGGDPRQGDKRAGGTRRAAELVQRLPQISTLFDDSRLRAVVDHQLGPGVRLGSVSFRCPMPGFGSQSLHGDDLPIGHAGECRAVTAIVALCDFTGSNGATAVVPGSHRRPDLQRDLKRLDLADREVLVTPVAGSALVFSSHLLLQAQWRIGGDPA
ncbi:MAG: phytanoyl-CoA dioxygenase family protein [Acidimicrobiales bacterium]